MLSVVTFNASWAVQKDCNASFASEKWFVDLVRETVMRGGGEGHQGEEESAIRSSVPPPPIYPFPVPTAEVDQNIRVTDDSARQRDQEGEPVARQITIREAVLATKLSPATDNFVTQLAEFSRLSQDKFGGSEGGDLQLIGPDLLGLQEANETPRQDVPVAEVFKDCGRTEAIAQRMSEIFAGADPERTTNSGTSSSRASYKYVASERVGGVGAHVAAIYNEATMGEPVHIADGECLKEYQEGRPFMVLYFPQRGILHVNLHAPRETIGDEFCGRESPSAGMYETVFRRIEAATLNGIDFGPARAELDRQVKVTEGEGPVTVREGQDGAPTTLREHLLDLITNKSIRIIVTGDFNDEARKLLADYGGDDEDDQSGSVLLARAALGVAGYSVSGAGAFLGQHLCVTGKKGTHTPTSMLPFVDPETGKENYEAPGLGFDVTIDFVLDSHLQPPRRNRRDECKTIQESVFYGVPDNMNYLKMLEMLSSLVVSKKVGEEDILTADRIAALNAKANEEGRADHYPWLALRKLIVEKGHSGELGVKLYSDHHCVVAITREKESF